ncbi:MAG: DUF4396 domain-containing protein [Sphingomonas bacterium]
MNASFPAWLHALAAVSVVLGVICALVISVDEVRRPQKMAIMYLVWPLTALFGSVVWMAGYFAWGRGTANPAVEPPEQPFVIMVAKGTSHCGAGCTLGDLIAEWLVFAVPTIAVWFGWHSAFTEKTFAVWIPDFMLAFGLGVVFQYFTIKPMRDLSVGGGILAALKADIASIASWQVGMYGVMAIIQFGWFRPVFGMIAPVDSFEFWFAMQLAMIAGFVTAYPVNWLLIHAGWKERM